ncbi:MAG: NAD(P)H-binding protein [Acidobacteriota bacterium]
MILVTGATGNVGSELVKQLLDASQPVRVLVRSQQQEVLPVGAEIFNGDLNEPQTLTIGLKGVRAVFLLGGYHDMSGLLSVIEQAGVEHVVLLTSRSVVQGNPSNAIVRMWMESEDAVQSAKVPWTILRPSGFMSNVLRWLPQLGSGNIVRAPFFNVPIAAIDPYDIAATAVIALTSNGHLFRSYTLSGPAAILPADQVRILAKVLGRDLCFEAQSDREAREEMSKSWSPDFVDAFFRFFADGEFDDSLVLPTVQEMTGRPPRTFQEWARAHVDTFR